MLRLSYSQIQLYRSCQQAFFYRYIEGIQRKETAVPLELGSLIHEYLANYYNNIVSKRDSAEAHADAYQRTTESWKPKLEDMAETAYMVGAEETAESLRGLWEQAEYIIQRYYIVHGAEDAEQYEVILVEKQLLTKLARGIESIGYADLVARDRNSGYIYLFEHKTTKNPPRLETRLRDLQTALYAKQLEMETDIHVDGLVWNTIKTELPTIPHELKKGGFTRAQIDTTWHVYEKALLEAGVDPTEYEDMHERLENRERTEYFPRYNYLLLGTGEILLRDYLSTAKEMAQVRRDWAKGKREPIRAIAWQCDRCFANKLCTAAITLGGTDAVMGMYYTTRDQRKAVAAAQDVVLKLPVAAEEYEELV